MSKGCANPVFSTIGSCAASTAPTSPASCRSTRPTGRSARRGGRRASAQLLRGRQRLALRALFLRLDRIEAVLGEVEPIAFGIAAAEFGVRPRRRALLRLFGSGGDEVLRDVCHVVDLEAEMVE